MVDYLTEIPLPGRALCAPTADARRRMAELALPAFVAGPENRLVASAINRLLLHADTAPSNATNGSATVFTPSLLAIFGSSGTGKTHLSRGVVRYWQQKRGSDRAEYLTGSDFRRQFDAAMRIDAIAEFRQRLRGLELLAIDDLHQLPSAEYLWQELRHMLDERDEQAGAVVITSNRPANLLANLPADLRSRLAAGLVLQLAAPGTAARMRIIQQASAAGRRPLSADAAQRLAAGVRGTANDLFCALFELWSTAPAGAPTGATSVEHVLNARRLRRPEMPEIVAVVAKYCGQSQKALLSASRKQSTVFARSLVVYLARDLGRAKYEEIGRALGGRDHTTMMHNYAKIDSDRQRDPAIQNSIDELQRILLAR